MSDICCESQGGSGLYIHIPFCESKCIYCAFYSIADPSLRCSYIEALLKEAAYRAEAEGWKNHVFKSIYIGGGTPSVLPISDIVKIFDELSKILCLSSAEEITIELNPEHQKLIKELRTNTPINRLSIGVQSFDDNRLKFMRRRHSGKEAIEAVELAHKSGFNNISIDLIYGLPEMDIAEWNTQINTFKSLDIPHLSAYALTPEPLTLLQKQIDKHLLKLPSPDTLFEQYMHLYQWGALHGYEAYEVSNWALDKQYSKHNLSYWSTDTAYLGLGPSAHSFKDPHREANISNVKRYITEPFSPSMYSREELSLEDFYHEYIMTALRTSGGVSKKKISSFSSAIAKDCAIKMQKFIDNGLIKETSTAYTPSAEALYKADGLALDFF